MIERWVGPRRGEFTSETRLIYDAYTGPFPPFRWSTIDPRQTGEGSRGKGVCGEQTRDTAKLIVILVGRIINSQSASVSGWMLSRIRGSSPFSDLHPLFPPSCGHPYVTTGVFSAVYIRLRRYLAVLENDGQFRVRAGIRANFESQRRWFWIPNGTRDLIFIPSER